MVMEIINDTPFTFAPFAGRIYYPGHSLSLVVKATFDMHHEQLPSIVEEQLYPTGDEFYPGDDDGIGSVYYESDYAFAKTSSDRFLIGHCQGQDPARARKVEFTVGSLTKPLIVLGDRHWQSTTKYSDPEPFTKIPLRYENSIGGDAHPENPLGKGVEKDSRSAGYPLPNIEYGDQSMTSSQSRPPLAGFGPINRNWQSRAKKQGTYDKSYVKKRWPWFPEDFDWSFFNAAPLDQQTKEFLTGDESINISNMHPIEANYSSQLPGLRVRCFLNRKTDISTKTYIENDLAIEQFHEVGMNLDTLWVNMDTEQMVLAWRGWLEVSGEDYPEFSHCFIFSEPLSTATELPVVHERFLEWVEKLKDDEEEEETEDNVRLSPEELDKIVKNDLAQAKQEMRAHLIGLGVEPKDADKAFKNAEAAEQERIAKLEVPLVWNRDAVQLLIDQDKPLDELPLAELDLSFMNFNGVSIIGTDLTKTNLTGAILSGCDLSGSLLTQANLTEAQCVESLFIEADLFKANLSQAMLNKANLTGAFCDEAIFDHAIGEAITMADASAVKASLKQFNAQGSDLNGTDFSSSHVSEANFSQCNLQEASFSECVGGNTNFELSDLSALKASGANFSPGSCFVECLANESIWDEANLSGCDVRYSQFERANFMAAQLQQTDLSATNAKFAKFAGANLTQAKVVLTNLFEATLDNTILDHTDFRGSNMYGAELLNAKINKANFEQTNLRMTKLAVGGLMHEQ